MCKSFHSTGYCPYGSRCHFIHQSEEGEDRLDDNQSPTNPDFHFQTRRSDFCDIEKTLGSLSIGEWSTVGGPKSRSLNSVGSSESVWSQPKSYSNQDQAFGYGCNKTGAIGSEFAQQTPHEFDRTYGIDNEISNFSTEPWSGLVFSPGVIGRPSQVSSTGVSSSSDRDSISASPNNDTSPAPLAPYTTLTTTTTTTPFFRFQPPNSFAAIAALKPTSDTYEESRLPVFRSLSISEQ
jgi:hypothetical protein